MPGPRVRSPPGLGAASPPSPLSPLPPGAPVSQNGFPPGTVASRRGLRGHGHPPSSNLAWLPSLGRLRGQRAGGPCPGSEGPVCPRALRTGPTFVREGGAGASLEPAHTHSTGCRARPALPHPRICLGPLLLCRAAGGRPHLQRAGLQMVGGGGGARLRARLRPLPGCPRAHPRAQGSAVRGVPPHLRHREGALALQPPPRPGALTMPVPPCHSPATLGRWCNSPSDPCPGWSPKSPHASQEPWMAGTGLSASVQRTVWGPGVGCWLCGRHRMGVRGRWAGRNPGRGWPWPDPAGPI